MFFSSSVTFLPENVFLLLQSVVVSFQPSGTLVNKDVEAEAVILVCVLQMACQEKDTESLKSLQTELW